MAEENNQNQDQDPNLEDNDPSQVGEQPEVQDPEKDLEEIDSILGEEDPNFLKELAEIQIPAGVSISDAAIDIKQQIVKSPTVTQLRKLFDFKNNSKTVMIFWGFVVLSSAAITFAWKNQKSLISESLFLNSYASWNSDIQSYNPLSEYEYFYDNPRFSKNLIALSKMFANLRASENSGQTPMLALEINVEGISSDAIIELKDRESEFKDLMLRYIEERSYDELVTTEGKQSLLDQLRIIINSHLTQGQVRRVLLKSFIIKP